MANLTFDRKATSTALVPYAVHAIQVSVDPIDGAPVDREPGAAVHPWSPVAHAEHLVFRGDLGGQLAQLIDVQATSVVDSEIRVAVRAVLATGSASAQDDSYNAGYDSEPFDHFVHHETKPSTSRSMGRPV